MFYLKSSRPSLPLKKEFFLPLRLSCKESSTFSPSPSSSGSGDVTALRCSEPLRYKVGGPSKVSPYCAGWDRLVAMLSIPNLKPYLHESAKRVQKKRLLRFPYYYLLICLATYSK